MRLVINHLTRMQKGYICVAGIDLDSGKHVRPLLQSQLRKDLLVRYGGPFDIGRVVELPWTRYVGTRPETEDYLFHRSEARGVEDLTAGTFWELLCGQARTRLGEIFGPDLVPRGPASYAVDEGRGLASLGCYRPAGPLQLTLRRVSTAGRPQIRLEFRSGARDFDLSVTDIRLYGDDHVTPVQEVVQRVGRRLQQPEGVILGVGLTRAFRGQAGEPARHWLQVTNIHIQEDPCWRLA